MKDIDLMSFLHVLNFFPTHSVRLYFFLTYFLSSFLSIFPSFILSFHSSIFLSFFLSLLLFIFLSAFLSSSQSFFLLCLSDLQGMVLCAVSADHTVIKLLEAPAASNAGDRITFPGFTGEAASSAQMAKKKILEKLASQVFCSETTLFLFILKYL